jgi:hypothetical protein
MLKYFVRVEDIEDKINKNQSLPVINEDVFLQAFNKIKNNKKKLTIVFETSNNYITHLPKMLSFKYVSTMIIANCFITELPSLPNSIEYLEVQGTLIEKITKFPVNVKHIHLSSNRLTMIDNIPLSVVTLDVSFNQIVSLPPLNNHKYMKDLNVGYNRLESLVLPPKLKTLDFCKNNISFLTIYPCSNCIIPKMTAYDMISNPLIYPQDRILYISYGYIPYSSRESIIHTHNVLNKCRYMISLAKCRVRLFKWLLRTKLRNIEEIMNPANVGQVLGDDEEDINKSHERLDTYFENNLGYLQRFRSILKCMY